ncbi:Hypothetical Protein FCC1311_100202 [Hondaea fermentalgiana]|uniref:Zinc finger PHD-type domain-containing protein n=1 Tax=Hondaea fermentalgiana TaxID=2315210 RepID=A0A2R5GSE1_9STRA|nr:Hypothetical Protein FCC1311_100202 [Hondaea fermentalgiana]|eukprot:GBG33797.1 Hypothetical Protein FCC1311_100202 [Hondaea fermentalgiana]
MAPAIVADVVDLVSDDERSRDSLLAAIADGQDSTQRLLNNGEVVICENLCSNMPRTKPIRLDSAVLCLDEAGLSSTCKDPPSSPLPKPSGVMAPPPSPECTGVMAPPSSPLAGVKKRRRCRRFMTQQDSPPKKLRETDHEVQKTRMETLCLDIPDSPESVDLSIPGLTTPRASPSRPTISKMSNTWKDSDDSMKIPDSPDSVDLSIPGLTSPRIRPSKAASGTSSSNPWKGPLCAICAEPPAQSPLIVCGNCKVTLHAICADADPPFDRWLCVAYRMRILGRPMMPERKFNIRDLRVADLVPDGSAEREEARRNAWFLENKDSLYRNESSYVDDGADDYFASTSTAWEGIGTLGYFE